MAKRFRILNGKLVDNQGEQVTPIVGFLPHVRAIREHESHVERLKSGGAEVSVGVEQIYKLSVNCKCQCGVHIHVDEVVDNEDDISVFKDTFTSCPSCKREYVFRVKKGELLMKLNNKDE